MIANTYHDIESSVLNAPCLCIPPIDGLTTPANTAPDRFAFGTCIYLHLMASTGPTGDQTNVASVLPIITSAGQSYGGQVGMRGPKLMPKLVLEGFIDTPCIQVGEYFLPAVIDSQSVRYMYAEVIGMMFEGRANYSPETGWERLDPLWYRDPYGRVYTHIRILDFTATYVEGVPERTQFTMTLKIL